jgi:hypothetical protein
MLALFERAHVTMYNFRNGEEDPMRTMTKVISLLVVLALCAGGAFANCGHKETDEGTLKAVNADSNSVVVVDADGNEHELTLTAETQVTDAEGNETEVAELVGKKVKVVSEHAKIDSITQIA